jgi:hypothetical protein
VRSADRLLGRATVPRSQIRCCAVISMKECREMQKSRWAMLGEKVRSNLWRVVNRKERVERNGAGASLISVDAIGDAIPTEGWCAVPAV